MSKEKRLVFETIEEYLNRGGKIRKAPRGETAINYGFKRRVIERKPNQPTEVINEFYKINPKVICKKASK